MFVLLSTSFPSSAVFFFFSFVRSLNTQTDRQTEREKREDRMASLAAAPQPTATPTETSTSPPPSSVILPENSEEAPPVPPPSVSPSQMVIPIVCPGHNRPVVEVSFSPKTPDGIFHIAASLDSKAMLRSGETGDWIGTFEGHKGAVWSAKLNDTATRAATGSADFSVKLWDAITGEEVRTWNHHRHIVKSVDFSFGGGTKLLTGGRDKQAFVVDLENGGAGGKDDVLSTFAHPAEVTRVIWCDEHTVLTGSDDGILRVWDTRVDGNGGVPVKTIPVGSGVNDVELSYDKEIISVAAGKRVEFFSAQTFESVLSHDMEHDQKSLSLSPDRTQFLTAAVEKEWVYIYDYQSGKEVTCQKGHHGEVLSVRYSPTGKCYTSGAHDATLRLWKQQE